MILSKVRKKDETITTPEELLKSEAEALAANENLQSKECESVEDGKYAELEEKYLRLAAEYENFKRRSAREKDMLYNAAVADTIMQLLPILDNLKRAEGIADDADAASLAEGIKQIARQADEVFEKIGVTPIQAVGNEFDANLHNAVMHAEDDSFGANMVAEELLQGFMYRDKVIRHSMVKVVN